MDLCVIDSRNFMCVCHWDILYIVYVLLWVAFFFFRFKNYHPRLPHSSLKMRLSRMTVPFASSEHFLPRMFGQGDH